MWLLVAAPCVLYLLWQAVEWYTELLTARARDYPPEVVVVRLAEIRCPVCRVAFRDGDLAVRQFEKPLVHAACAPERARTVH